MSGLMSVNLFTLQYVMFLSLPFVHFGTFLRKQFKNVEAAYLKTAQNAE